MQRFCAKCADLLRSVLSEKVSGEESPTLGEAIRKTVESKKRLNRRKVYTDSLEQYLWQFARHAGADTPVDRITLEHLEEWWASRKEKPTTMRSNAGRLSAVFNYSVRHGWRRDNPVDNVEFPYVERQPPQILTVEQCEAALKFTLEQKPEFLAWLVLTMFVGLRPESEADNLERGRIDFENHRLIVTVSKVRSHRIIDLRQIPPAEPWLLKAVEVGARFQVPYSTRRKYLRALREHLGFDTWKQDILRHTAASYLLAHHQSAERVAMILGNSAGVIHRHYKSLVPPESASRFMSLLP